LRSGCRSGRPVWLITQSTSGRLRFICAVPFERSYQTLLESKAVVLAVKLISYIQLLLRGTNAELKLSYCLHRISPTHTTKHQIKLPFWGRKSLLSALKARKRGYYQNRWLNYFNSMTLNWICRFLTIGQYSTFFSNASMSKLTMTTVDNNISLRVVRNRRLRDQLLFERQDANPFSKT
jgi:hypothetical protein